MKHIRVKILNSLVILGAYHYNNVMMLRKLEEGNKELEKNLHNYNEHKRFERP
jgi:hypothetical protein